jgi:hypothetical protein
MTAGSLMSCFWAVIDSCRWLADQPRDQARVIARQALLEAEGLGIDRAEFE